jgi:hypothetical protein
MYTLIGNFQEWPWFTPSILNFLFEMTKKIEGKKN